MDLLEIERYSDVYHTVIRLPGDNLKAYSLVLDTVSVDTLLCSYNVVVKIIIIKLLFSINCIVRLFIFVNFLLIIVFGSFI